MAFRVKTLFGNFEKRAPDEKWQLGIFSQGMLVAVMFLFRILILLLVYNTMDNDSASGLNTKTLLQLVKLQFNFNWSLPITNHC